MPKINQKVIIVTGPERSGRTSLAKHMASSVLSKTEFIIKNGRELVASPFFYSDCSHSTDTVIIDDINKIERLKFLLLIQKVGEGITVLVPTKRPYVIHPKVILVIDPCINIKALIESEPRFLAAVDLILSTEEEFNDPGICHQCGCTDDDCSQCIEATGEACHWVAPNLCSACVSNSLLNKST